MLRFIIPSTLIGALVGGVVVYSTRTEPVKTVEARPYIPAGQKILEAFNCGEGETKLTYVRGIIDDFSTAGDERALVGVSDEILETGELPRLLNYNTDYDSFSADRVVADVFEIPTDTASGIFVTSFRPLNGGSYSDVLSLGSVISYQIEGNTKVAPFLSTDPGLRPVSILDMRTETPHQKWEVFHQEGTTYKFPLSDLKLSRSTGAVYGISEFSILDLLQSSPQAKYPLLVYLSEDHTVDYFALSVCERPAREFGATFLSAHDTLEVNKVEWTGAGLSCWSEEYEHACNTDKGDTACEESHPIACFQDIGESPPAALNDIVQVWTGGRIEFTEPIRGDSIKTRSEADMKCQSSFGQDWRVLSGIETGGGSSTLFGHGTPLDKGERAWVDTPGAPYGTCWDREK